MQSPRDRGDLPKNMESALSAGDPQGIPDMLAASLGRIEQLFGDQSSCRREVAHHLLTLETCSQQLASELVSLRKQVMGEAHATSTLGPELQRPPTVPRQPVNEAPVNNLGVSNGSGVLPAVAEHAVTEGPVGGLRDPTGPVGGLRAPTGIPSPGALLESAGNGQQSAATTSHVQGACQGPNAQEGGPAGACEGVNGSWRSGATHSQGTHQSSAFQLNGSVATTGTVISERKQKFQTVLEIAKTSEHVGPFPADDEAAVVQPPEHLGCVARFRKRWGPVVQSPKFDMLVGFVIVANTLVMSLQLEVEGWLIRPDEVREIIVIDDAPRWVDASFEIAEHIFTAVFALELALRLFSNGLLYLSSIANMGDAVIVVISSLDSWVLTPMGSEALSNVGVLRLLRLVRLAKVLRVVRVMKAFSSLRVLVSAVMASVGALAWSMTLLFVLELIGAILLAQVLRPYIEDDSQDFEFRMWLWERFGTWLHAMFTVFEITMAPGGFINYRRLAAELNPLFGLLVAFYVCLVTFAVVRVITAMFLKATLAASDKDEDQQGNERRKKLEAAAAFAENLLMSLEQTNADCPTTWVDEAELVSLLEIEQMKEWTDEVGLQETEVRRLFRALDDGRGVIPFRDFIQVLRRMRGAPRCSDIVVELYESQLILKQLALLNLSNSAGYQVAAVPPKPLEVSPRVQELQQNLEASSPLYVDLDGVLDEVDTSMVTSSSPLGATGAGRERLRMQVTCC